MKYTFRPKRASLVMMSIFLASLGGSISLAAPNPEAARALKTFRVHDFEKVVIPDSTQSYVGKRIELKTDRSKVLRVGLGYRFVASIGGNVEAVVGGMPQSISAGEIFTRRKVSGGRIAELPIDALILCREPVQHNFGQAMASAATLGLTQLAAKYAADVQLCAVDADRDGNLEKLFLGGAKQQQDLEFSNINPTPYEYSENYPVDGVNLVIYAMKTILEGPVLITAIESQNRLTDLTLLKFEHQGKLKHNKTSVTIKKDKFPQEVRLGSAVLLIKNYDATAGIIDSEFIKYFDTQQVDWYIAPKTMFIYY